MYTKDFIVLSSSRESRLSWLCFCFHRDIHALSLPTTSTALSNAVINCPRTLDAYLGPTQPTTSCPRIGRPQPGPPTDFPTRNWVCAQTDGSLAVDPDARCNITPTVLAVASCSLWTREAPLVVAPWS